MKKIIITMALLTIMLFAVSCENKDTGLTPGVNNVPIPVIEDYSLTVNDEYDNLYEPLKQTYKAGETVVVKTSIIMDASIVVELNGAEAIRKELIQDSEGHYLYNEWKFVMPEKDSVLDIFVRSGMDALYYDVTLEDSSNVVINEVAGMYEVGKTIEIHTYTRNVMISINDTYLNDNTRESIMNDEGEFLYYKQAFTMPQEDVVVKIGYICTETAP